MIRYGNAFEFAAAPRTGVRGALSIIQLMGLGPGFPNRAYMPWEGTETVLRVSLVRHPFDWLHRFYVTGPPKSSLGVLQSLNRQGSFLEMVADYLDRMPGAITELYQQYTLGAGSIMRTEDMPFALVELGLSLGVHQTLLANIESRVMVSNTPSRPSSVEERWYWNQVLDVDKEIAHEYDYS